MTEEIINDEAQEEENLITLIDEEGNEVLYYHIGTLDYEGKWYCVLQVADPQTEEEEEEVAIYELVGEEPDLSLEPIEDDAVLEAVFERFCDEFEQYEDENEEN